MAYQLGDFLFLNIQIRKLSDVECFEISNFLIFEFSTFKTLDLSILSNFLAFTLRCKLKFEFFLSIHFETRILRISVNKEWWFKSIRNTCKHSLSKSIHVLSVSFRQKFLLDITSPLQTNITPHYDLKAPIFSFESTQLLQSLLPNLLILHQSEHIPKRL